MLLKRFQPRRDPALAVVLTVSSFGFKYGPQLEADCAQVVG